MEDSLVMKEGMLVKFPSVPLATCLFHMQLLLQGSFHQEEVKRPDCCDKQRPRIMNFWGLLRLLREIMLLLDGISVGGQSTRERERGFTPVMSVTKLSSLCKCLASTKFGSTVEMCLPARVVARS